MSCIPKSLNLATLLLLLASGVSILPISQPGIVPPVQAQTNETKKAEAERLFNEGMQLLPLWRKLGDKVQEAFINLALGKWMVQQGVRSQSLPSPRKLVIGARDNKSFFY